MAVRAAAAADHLQRTKVPDGCRKQGRLWAGSTQLAADRIASAVVRL
jgi:hypothetical protein